MMITTAKIRTVPVPVTKTPQLEIALIKTAMMMPLIIVRKASKPNMYTPLAFTKEIIDMLFADCHPTLKNRPLQPELKVSLPPAPRIDVEPTIPTSAMTTTPMTSLRTMASMLASSTSVPPSPAYLDAQNVYHSLAAKVGDHNPPGTRRHSPSWYKFAI
uniref:Uncharacterized protein n=1 Tax=Romanomermis culicivorax TaxID=13658 RepID=A0A915ICB0_ROMCU